MGVITIVKHSKSQRRILLKKIAALLLMLSSSVLFAKEVALSFDDGLNPATNPEASSINQSLLAVLAKKNVKAIIYPSLAKTGQADGIALVANWGKNGHRIGNHSEAHISLNKADTDLAVYIEGIANAQKTFSQLDGWVPRYRFPYLKEGDTVEKRDGVRDWLAEHQYLAGDVSIDASDWYYNQLFIKYQQANDAASLKKLKKAYIAHIVDRARYYDDLAQQQLNRSPKHVYLLHVNAINAAFIGEAIDALRQQGWTLIDSDTAYKDPMYQQVLNVLPAGESIVWAIAKANGTKGLRYPAEDSPYEKDNLSQYGLMVP